MVSQFLAALPLFAPVWLAWIVFYGYWGASIIYEVATGRFKKRERSGQPPQAAVAQTLLLGAAIVLEVDPLIRVWGTGVATNYSPLQALGVAVAFIGVGFAIWARRHLGGNWSGDVTIKKGHTLTKTGPYALVRHPIYFGIFLIVAGCAIYLGTASAALAVAFGALFVAYRVSTEERLMKAEFGREWELYKKEVRYVIVPRVL